MNFIKLNLKKIPGTVIYFLVPTLTLLISFALIYFLLLPAFSSMIDSSGEIKAKRSKLNSIEQSINTLAAIDNTELAGLSDFLDHYIPEKLDMLTFASLNEKIAAVAGARVSSIAISKNPLAETGPQDFGTRSDLAVSAVLTNVSVAYTSSFSSMVTLTGLWKLADQFVGINEVTVNSRGDGSLAYSISYDLTASDPVSKATIDNFSDLTQKEKDLIRELESKITFVATPSSKPVGKTDPFK